MLPIFCLIVGTVGIVLFGATMAPALNDRGTTTIRVRVAALAMFALGMVAFGISFAILGG